MSPRWRKRIRRLPAHRLCACISLICYLVVAIGMPLPALATKEPGQPFPCQDHPCGCLNAEQCWRHCCCFTPEEKLAWAQARGVEPPAYAERPDGQGWHDVRLRDRTEEDTNEAIGPSTSQSGERKAPCKRCRTACCDKSDHCQVDRCQAASDNPMTGPCEAKKTTSRWTLGLAALRCRGLSTTWVFAGTVPPPTVEADGKPFLPLVDKLADLGVSGQSNSSLPPDPPPRRTRT
jgi:hypothetical protein